MSKSKQVADKKMVFFDMTKVYQIYSDNNLAWTYFSARRITLC